MTLSYVGGIFKNFNNFLTGLKGLTVCVPSKFSELNEVSLCVIICAVGSRADT